MLDCSDLCRLAIVEQSPAGAKLNRLPIHSPVVVGGDLGYLGGLQGPLVGRWIGIPWPVLRGMLSACILETWLVFGRHSLQSL